MKRIVMLFMLLLFPAAGSMAITFSQLAIGGGYETVLILTNKNVFTWNGSIDLYSGYNKKWQGPYWINDQNFTGLSGTTVSLNPMGSMKIRITGDSTTRSGYLDIIADSGSAIGDIAVSYFYEFRDETGLQDTVGSQASARSKKLELNVEKSTTVDTGIAWCPSNRSSTNSFQIVLVLYDQNGDISQKKTVTFNGHKAQFISQLFPDLPPTFFGHLLITAQEIMYVEVLRLETTATGFQLTSTPADDNVP